MTIDYTRPPRRATPPPSRPEPQPRLAPEPQPDPEPAVHRPSPSLLTVKALTAVTAGMAWDQGYTLAGALLALVAVLSWWRARQAVRYLLAVAGMAAIRWWVVRKARPYAGELDAPGSVTDPAAPWRQWLDTSCPTCGQ